MKICFTTALFGDLKTLDKPAKFERNPNYDYFLFTDIDGEHFDTSWDIINIKDNPNISNLTSTVRKSRYPKFMSWELLESLGKSYDVVFYCDAQFSPRIDFDWVECAENVLKPELNEFGFMQTYHHTARVFNRGINGDIRQILRGRRDTRESMNKTRQFLKMHDESVDLNKNVYYENTTFGYSMNDDVVRNLLSEFWKIYTSEDITFRDQPLWNFLLIKHNLTPSVCNQIAKKNDKGDVNWGGAFTLSGEKAKRFRV